MNDELLNKIKLISNRLRFKIIELTQDDEYSITELSSELDTDLDVDSFDIVVFTSYSS